MLARAGHEVTIFEKERELGGHMATRSVGNGSAVQLDYGITHFTVKSPGFRAFVDELEEQGLAAKWSRNIGYFDGDQLHEMNPNVKLKTYWAPTRGFDKIVQYLSRWVEVKTAEKAGGLTYIGPDRRKKRSWMINLTDISVFECDAVIIAAPAPQALGVLQTAQDETPARKIIRHIDEIRYHSAYALMALYRNREIPPFDGVYCDDDRLSWVINETSKKDSPQGDVGLVIQSGTSFADQHRKTAPERIEELLLERTGEIIGGWCSSPDWTDIHYWKHTQAVNPMDELFLEMDMEGAALALVGDYLGGNTLESAYLSGYNLADYWIEKYKEVVA